MTKSSKKLINIILVMISVLSIALFAYALTPKTLQNDTFYTIKIGEHLDSEISSINDVMPWNSKIDMQDQFSWHKNLPYTYPHWLYDLATYKIYKSFGFNGIYIATCLLSILLGLTIYFINKKLSKKSILSFVVTLFAMYFLRGFIATRAQLVTFILFALTIFFIEQFLKSKKITYAVMLVIIPIIIANIHSAVWPFYFILYLPYIAEYIIYRLITTDYIACAKGIKLRFNKKKKVTNEQKENLKKEKLEYKNNIQNFLDKSYKVKVEYNKNVKFLIIIVTLCAFTGLLTPIKDVPYTYLIKTMIGNTTKSISEHLPLTLAENINMIVFLCTTIGVLTFTKVKIKLRDLFMLGGLIFLSFKSQRQVSMLVLIGGFILVRLIGELVDISFIKLKEKIGELLKLILTLGTCFIVVITTLGYTIRLDRDKNLDSFIDEKEYPVQAADYIENSLIPKVGVENLRLYNEYNYGSYLLYRGIPVFIDSRADLYAPEFNGKKGQDKKYEGRDIFTDALDIASLTKDYEIEFNKYEVTHVITYSNSKLNAELEKDNRYSEIYSDKNFTVYKRNSIL